MKITQLLCRHGTLMASGVPGMVLLSVGSVVAISGNAAAVIWPLSAVIGGVMSLLFGALVSDSAAENGGIAVAAARVFEPRFRGAAAIAQWAYWLGWAATPAIYGSMIGGYVHNVLMPHSGPALGIVIAFAVTALVFATNLLPILVVARIQTFVVWLTGSILVLLTFQGVSTVLANPWPHLSLAPPGGWTSRAGLVGVMGGFFLAGWTAYGAEIALTYLRDYREGCAAACRSLVIVVLLTIAAYTFFPLLMIFTLNTPALAGDPNVALTGWFGSHGGLFADLVILTGLSASMFLAINMTTLASSRLLGQLSANGYCRLDLARENRAGRPWRALAFDFTANMALLLVIVLLEHDDLSAIPSALLATANVGYFVSLILGLVACAMADRARRRKPWRVALSMGLVLLNAVFLVFAGVAWGWGSIALGVVILLGVSAALSPASAAGILASPWAGRRSA